MRKESRQGKTKRNSATITETKSTKARRRVTKRTKTISSSSTSTKARKGGAMREGAFALVDCLGFTGIWKRGDYRSAEQRKEYQQLLLEKLKMVRQEVPKLVKSGVRPYKYFSDPVVVGVYMLSDSVAISLQYDEDLPPKGRYKNYLVWLICEATIKVLDRFRKDKPELVLRGCITYGEHVSEGNFIVGPAVDDAAENMEVAQGAFVWLHPTAWNKYRQCIKTTEATIEKLKDTHDHEELLLIRDLKRALEKPLVVDNYKMPLKIGGHLQCPVLNPLAFHKTEPEQQKVIRECLEAMSGNQLDVLLKRQYTKEFLEEAKVAREAHRARYTKFIDSLG
jgi:hypothetical protein